MRCNCDRTISLWGLLYESNRREHGLAFPPSWRDVISLDTENVERNFRRIFRKTDSPPDNIKDTLKHNDQRIDNRRAATRLGTAICDQRSALCALLCRCPQLASLPLTVVVKNKKKNRRLSLESLTEFGAGSIVEEMFIYRG